MPSAPAVPLVFQPAIPLSSQASLLDTVDLDAFAPAPQMQAYAAFQPGPAAAAAASAQQFSLQSPHAQTHAMPPFATSLDLFQPYSYTVPTSAMALEPQQQLQL